MFQPRKCMRECEVSLLPMVSHYHGNYDVSIWLGHSAQICGQRYPGCFWDGVFGCDYHLNQWTLSEANFPL